jgi:hypothetical protein
MRIDIGDKLLLRATDGTETEHVIRDFYIDINDKGNYEAYLVMHDTSKDDVSPTPVWTIRELIAMGIMYPPSAKQFMDALHQSRKKKENGLTV